MVIFTCCKLFDVIYCNNNNNNNNNWRQILMGIFLLNLNNVLRSLLIVKFCLFVVSLYLRSLHTWPLG